MGAPADVGDAVTRKVVTVVFGDLVGSTSFGEQVDAESVREALADYHTMARRTIESFGGSVAKFIGDGVMALFGAPEIAEDDADRAVAAGLALQRGFAPISRRVAERHGVDLGLRVGVNTGELVLSAGDTDVVGDAVNTAARLEAACTPGDVLVGEETWRLTRGHIRYEVLGEVDVKGKSEPVATFRVAGDDVAEEDQSTPFVGRVDELARLRAVFDDSVDRRAARLVTVIGSPGVGKTRISREFGDALGDGAAVAVLRCERAGTATFAPIADLLRTLTAVHDDADPEHVRSVLFELVADLDDAERVTELLASFVGAAPTRSTEEAFLAVRRLVEATGRRRPLVVVVDDIQWAEPLFLDLLEHLAEWVHDSPTVLVGLARPELREIRPSLAQPGRGVADSISLEGLDAEATAELAARLVGAESLPRELLDRLPDSTEGNPLFVRELMRMLVDDGVIEQRDGEWELTIDADAVEVPPTIQSLLATRLDRMPADERRLVELASVVGPEFALGAVAAIADAGTATDLRLTLERLRRRELVESTGAYWGDEPVFRFHHVLIRDAAYRRLLKRARADLHLRVGEWTERTASGLPGEHEVAIAYHYEQAHEYRRQLDDVDDAIAAVGARAAELLGIAAERSLERDDLQAASTLAERALARLDGSNPMVPTMLIVAAEALLGLGDVGRGRPVVERLAGVAGDGGRLSQWADAFVAQLLMLTEPDRLQEAEQLADAAAERLEALGDEAGVAKARLVRAGALARLGQIGRCEAELDLALTAARSAGDRRRVTAVLGAAPEAALWGPSPIPRAGGRCLDVVRLLRITTGSPAVEAASMRCQAVLEALRGRFDTARSMLTDARATVEELGLRHALAATDLYAGIVELLAGDAATAAPALRSAYRGLGRLGIGADAGQAAAYLARALLQLGRVDEAEELAAQSAELAGENPQTAIAARTAQAEILAAQGRYDEAVEVAGDAVARAEGTDIIVDHAAASAVLARVAALAGDEATAARAAAAADDLHAQKAATATSGPSTSVAADPSPAPLAGSEGRHDAAPGGDGEGAWNEADRLVRRFVGYFTAGERDGWLPMVASDQETSDLRPLVGVDTTGVGGVADLYPRDENTRGMTSHVETIAARGDRFALHRWRAVSGSEREWDALYLTRWTPAGQNDLLVIFPPEEIVNAVRELDRLYLDEVTEPILRIAVSVQRDMVAAAAAHDLERFTDLGMGREFSLVDHRPLGFPEHGHDEMTARWGVLLDASGSVEVYPELFLEPAGTSVALRLRNRLLPDEGEFGLDDLMYIVCRHDPASRHTARVDHFGIDQVDEVRALLEERSIEPIGRWNGVSILGGWIHTLVELDRLDLLGDVVADGVEVVDLAGEVVRGLDAFVARAGETCTGNRRVLTIGGDRRALVAVLDDREVPMRFVVEELGDDGRLVSMRLFGPDDLAGASADFDRRWYDTLSDPNDADATSIEHMRAWQAFDVDRLSTILDDAYVGVDRRPLVGDTSDKSKQLANVQALRGTGDLLLAAGEPLVRSAHGNVTPVMIVGRDATGRLTESMSSLAASIVSDRRVVRVEVFPIEEPEAAIAWFDEFTGGAAPDPHESWNRADGWVRRITELWVEVGSDAWTTMIAPGYVSDDRRRLVAHRVEGAGAVADLFDRDDVDASTRSSVETIAVRGDHLALHRWTIGVRDGNVEYDTLNVSRWTDEGLVDLHVRFDGDRLAEAIDELNRLYLDELGDTTAGLQFGVLLGGIGLVPDGDVEGFVALHAPGFVMRDHRPLGWGDLELDEYAERIRSIADVPAEVLLYQERIHVIEGATLSTCLSQNLLFRFPDGSEQSSRSVMVMMMDPSTGLMVSMDQFAEDDVDAAIECYEGLIADRGPVLHNDATIRAALVYSWSADGDHESLSRLVADDVELVDGDGTAIELPRVERRDVVAVRGDRLALVQVSGPGSAFVVEEFDGAGRLSSVTRFAPDRFADAVRKLDERWLEADAGVVSAVMRTVVEYSLALNRADTEALGLLLHDDHELIDHRSLGWPRLNREQVLADVGAEGRESENTANVTSQRLADHEAGVLASIAGWRVFPDGASTQGMVAFVVVHVVDGRIMRTELFGDLDQARASFDALAPTSGDPALLPENAATRHRDDYLVNHRGAEVISSDYVAVDRRTTVSGGVRGADEFVDGLEFFADRSAETTCTTLAIRGDRFSLFRASVSAGDLVIDALVVNALDEDGLLVRNVIFDPDDLASALAELDAQWLPTLDPQAAATRQVAAEFTAAYVAVDVERLRAVLTPDFEWVDHLPARRFPPQDLETFLTATLQRREVMGDGIVVTRQIHSIDRGVMVTSSTILPVEHDAATWSEEIITVIVVRDGGLSRIESFAPDDLDGAFARAAELAGASSGVQLNAAGRMLFEMCARWNAREHVTDLLADDFVRVDRRAVVAMPDADRRGMAEVAEGMWAAGARWPDEPMPAMAERGDRIALFRGHVTLDDGASAISYLTILQIDADGLARRMMLLDDPEQLDEAIVEIDRLAAEEEITGDTTQAAHRPALQNAAMSWVDRIVAARGLVDIDVFTDDFVREDRRRGVAAGPADRTELIESLRVQLDLGASYVWHPIAVRGDSFAAGRLDVSYDDNEVGFLVMVEMADETRARRVVQLDPDDVETAAREMNRAWAASLGEEYRPILRLSGELARVTRSVDLDGITELMSDDVALIDHRALGAGSLDVESFKRYHGQRSHEGVVTGLAPETHVLAPHVILFQSLETTDAGDGTTWEEIFHHVLVGRDGKIERWEWFGADQRAAARARARELAR